MKRTSSKIRCVPCPHCEADAHIQKTRQLSKTFREITCHCTNENCGCTFIASIEPIRILSPSANPDPTVRIPMSPHVDVKALQNDLFKSLPKPEPRRS